MNAFDGDERSDWEGEQGDKHWFLQSLYEEDEEDETDEEDEEDEICEYDCSILNMLVSKLTPGHQRTQ